MVATQVQGCLWFAAALKVVLLLAWLGIAGLLAYAYLDEWLSDSGGYSRIYLLLSLSFVAASTLRWGLLRIKELFEDEYNLTLTIPRLSSRELFEALSHALEQSAEASARTCSRDVEAYVEYDKMKLKKLAALISSSKAPVVVTFGKPAAAGRHDEE